MADEQQTDVTNSAAATQTDAAANSDPNTSPTTSDELDAPSLLGDTATDGVEKPGDDGGDPAGDDAGKSEAEALIGAPEGDYQIALPEGMVIDADALAAVAPVAKELNLSNAGLSKLAGVYAEKVLPAATQAATQAIIGNVSATRAGWDAETRAAIVGGKADDGSAIAPDPMFGGKPMDAVLATSAKALDRFGGAEFRTFLKDTGLGNHPAMVKFAFQAGSLISEDNEFHKSGGVPNTPKTTAEKFYGRG